MNVLPKSSNHLSLALALLLAALCASCASPDTMVPSQSAPPARSERGAAAYNPHGVAQGQQASLFPAGRSASAFRPITANSLGPTSKVLMIGDSLTVGPFGDQIEAWLLQNLGPNRVAIYGSCGSSPEQWLASHKNFVSPCGYRETTSLSHITHDSGRGHRSNAISTPKIETLMAKYRPQIVIVQLGTNHFDTVLREGKRSLPELAEIYEAFANAVYGPGSSTRMVIWIAPPDSSKFPKWVQDEVENLISSTNRKRGFYTFQSRKFTHYTPACGSDGVHYNTAAATAWAAPVIRMLDSAFTKHRVKN
ncbi:MAG: SGNH/GDSL hydrolase family protein [Verrucomicrobiota bacterium]